MAREVEQNKQFIKKIFIFYFYADTFLMELSFKVACLFLLRQKMWVN